MNLRPKYSLRLFLIFATAVTVFFGYSQLRRKQILQLAEQLRADGYHFVVPSDWTDYVWQRPFTVGKVVVVGGTPYLETERERQASKGRIAVYVTRLPIGDGEAVWLRRMGLVEHE